MEYSKFTPKHALHLAAPQTWSAAILPVLLAAACAEANGYAIPWVALCVLLAISILMQSAVNALNDYFDFMKGTDSLDDCLEADDAVLLHENVNPKTVLALSLGLLGAAFILGIYIIYISGIIPLAIAVIGALCVLLYSGGKTPISYWPIGELVSGFVMGGLICLASYYALTLSLDLWVLLWSSPLVLTIGLIMMTNNTCDIEKDARAGRRTLPVLLSRGRARGAYHGIIVATYMLIAVITCIWYLPGAILLPFGALISIPVVSALWKCPLTQAVRVQAMSLASTFNIVMGLAYCLCVIAGGNTVMAMA